MPKNNKSKKFARAIPYQKNRSLQQMNNFAPQQFSQGFCHTQNFQQMNFHFQPKNLTNQQYSYYSRQSNPWPEQRFYNEMDSYQHSFYNQTHFEQPCGFEHQPYSFGYYVNPMDQMYEPDYYTAQDNLHKEMIEELKKSSENIALSEQKATEKLLDEIKCKLNVAPEDGFAALKLITEIKSGRSSITEHELSAEVEHELADF